MTTRFLHRALLAAAALTAAPLTAVAGTGTIEGVVVDTRGARGTNDAAFVMGAMRTPFFLLLLADDLSRAFLPIFAAGLPSGGQQTGSSHT